MEITKNNNDYTEIQGKRLSSPLNKKDNLNDSSNNKNKGYARILRNYIKKKNNALKFILGKKFKRWKKEAFKGMFIRKTIIVRISVSRDNIFKNRFNSKILNRIHPKDIKPKSEDKNLNFINKTSKMDTKENNINYIKWKNENEVKTPERKKEEFNTKPIRTIVYKNEKNPIFNTYNNVKQNNNPTYSQTIQNDHVSHKYHKNLAYKKQNHNINQYKLNYHKRPVPTLKSYGINNFNRVIQNTSQNRYNTYTSPISKKNQGFTGYTYINSNPKTPINNQDIKNKETLTPYTTKKSINIRKNFSEAKLFDKNNAFRCICNKNLNDKYSSVDHDRKYISRTAKRDINVKKKLEKEKLKKGITTVVQHYLGVMEKFDYYNLLTN